MLFFALGAVISASLMTVLSPHRLAELTMQDNLNTAEVQELKTQVFKSELLVSHAQATLKTVLDQRQTATGELQQIAEVA